jgi:hypothetical protein
MEHSVPAQAQHLLDLHVTSAVTGRCLVCRRPGPCAARVAAERLFAEYGLLPARRPAAAVHTGEFDMQPAEPFPWFNRRR